MDTLKIIQEKIARLPKDDQLLGIKFVATHIDIAEKYFVRAKKENDENLYTDVIYRTNHAFEGILKEAYRILTEKDSSKRTPSEIERYLTDNSIFKARVLDLFKNYRTEWRNTSTHDYKLFFTEQEAFLAIVSVTAFVNILLDQIIERINYRLEKKRTESHVAEIRKSFVGYDFLPLLKKLRELILAFTREGQLSQMALLQMDESEILGVLSGFIASVDQSIEVIQEPILPSNVRPDLVLASEGEKAILELRRAPPREQGIAAAQDQLCAYMLKGNINNGILYFYLAPPPVTTTAEDVQLDLEGKILNITKVITKTIPKTNSP